MNQWGKWFGESVPMEAIFLLKLRRVEGVIQVIDLGKAKDKFVIVMERPKAVSVGENKPEPSRYAVADTRLRVAMSVHPTVFFFIFFFVFYILV